MRTFSARTFEALLDESNVLENEVRLPHLRYARTHREAYVSSFETNAPCTNLGTPRARGDALVDARRPTRKTHVARVLRIFSSELFCGCNNFGIFGIQKFQNL